jgi:iron complex transport system ATP-binding protein
MPQSRYPEVHGRGDKTEPSHYLAFTPEGSCLPRATHWQNEAGLYPEQSQEHPAASTARGGGSNGSAGGRGNASPIYGPILTVDDLDFSYRRCKTLSGVSFSVRQGEICGLLGPNGSGKTTLLKCINRILEIETGRIEIHGREVRRIPRQEIATLIAVVPQELNMVFSFTVLQTVLMAGSMRFGISGIAKKEDRLSALEILGELNIEDLAERRYNELSGGEKQMVLIARALFQKAGILLLDEPTAHLDFKRQHIILELIKKITVEKNLTTVMTLHDPNVAGRYCDRLIMLNNGCVRHQGLRDKVFHVESLESLYDMKISMGYTDTGAEYVLPAYEQ